MSPRRMAGLAAVLLLGTDLVEAQMLPLSEGSEVVATDSGEAWAMRYVGAATIMTALGRAPDLAAGDWAVSAELGHIPHLDTRQQQVGLGGSKQEDLNKSPVFGRGRLWIGLPAGWVAELGYSPPLTIDGTHPEDLFAAAVSRRWGMAEWGGVNLRLLGQHGRAKGDITCPDDVVGAGPDENPFRCSRRSEDRISLNYYGAESTLDFGQGAWSGHISAGWLRYEPRVQVNAELTQYVERIRLLNAASLRFVAVGAGFDLRADLRVVAEVLYVPLDVRRPSDFERESDDFWSLRVAVRWQP